MLWRARQPAAEATDAHRSARRAHLPQGSRGRFSHLLRPRPWRRDHGLPLHGHAHRQHVQSLRLSQIPGAAHGDVAARRIDLEIRVRPLRPSRIPQFRHPLHAARKPPDLGIAGLRSAGRWRLFRRVAAFCRGKAGTGPPPRRGLLRQPGRTRSRLVHPAQLRGSRGALPGFPARQVRRDRRPQPAEKARFGRTGDGGAQPLLGRRLRRLLSDSPVLRDQPCRQMAAPIRHGALRGPARIQARAGARLAAARLRQGAVAPPSGGSGLHRKNQPGLGNGLCHALRNSLPFRRASGRRSAPDLARVPPGMVSAPVDPPCPRSRRAASRRLCQLSPRGVRLARIHWRAVRRRLRLVRRHSVARGAPARQHGALLPMDEVHHRTRALCGF
ncbi:MAG: hypothetical protein BWZ10_00783 [candidate division BRC1 bacterium ADurb.BinA364]|nr:MAG: hypothetical protein BWZ10_00783 [candidate division BRC1 bacterium ADurb.BinA364]